VVSSGLSSMNPSAHSAHPEYELSTVMTTGMSAPPMDAVMWRPRLPESRPMPARANMPAAGDGLAIIRAMQLMEEGCIVRTI